MSARPRIAWRALHGVLLIDKTVGPTSNGVLGHARRLWRAEKGGHTGTLDPLASGLLPLCFGAATKFAQVALEADKSYRATLRLGITREGGDLEGAVLREREVKIEGDVLATTLRRFTGVIDQVPPMHSALKHEGRPLHELARAGITVERAARRVTIHRIELVECRLPTVVIDVQCSKGTYIRTLAEDIGEALGCGAHLEGLQRCSSGDLHLRDAITLEAAEAMDETERDTRLLPVDTLLQRWPRIELDAANAGRFLTGLRRRIDHADVDAVRVYGPALDGGTPRFLGAAHVHTGELIPDRLLSPLEVAAATPEFSSTPI